MLEKQYFKKILNNLVKNKIPYTLLRDDNFFKSKNKKSEFDILIPLKKLKDVKKIFKNIPNTRVFGNNIDLTHPFLIRVIRNDMQVDFDFQIGGIAYCGSPVLKEKFLFQNTVKKDDLICLNTEAEFLMLLVHGFVFKKRFKYFKKYEKKFLELYKKSDKNKIHKEIKNMFGLILYKKIINYIEKKDLESLFGMQRKLRNKHLLKNPLRIYQVLTSKAMRFRNYFNLDKFFYFINPFKWAPLITFIGSDGSGKSTLTEKTSSYMDSFSIENKKMSLGVFSPIKNPFRKKIKKDSYSKRVLKSYTQKSNLELFVRIILQIPRQLKVLYYRKKGIMVISDRYPYDIVNFYGANGILKFLVKILNQKPTKCFYVKVSPENLRKRNDDLNLSAIKEVVSRTEKNKKYFSLIKLENEDFNKSEKKLNDSLSGVIKNV